MLRDAALRVCHVAPAARAALIHVACIPAAVLVAGAIPAHAVWPALEGVAAAAIGHGLGLASWWLPINLLFVPALTLGLALELAPAWYLGAFLLLVPVYWTACRNQVPLYLTNRAACKALASLLPQRAGFSFVDLGCGFGGVLAQLARARPDGEYLGVEAAPLPWFLSRWRMRHALASCRTQWGDLWNVNLAHHDVVYAYLSPVPMARLWEKARREMRPGTLFVSNSFGVPGVAPDYGIAVGGTRSAMLHVWHM